jgi:peroxiredoxin Q/BCP
LLWWYPKAQTPGCTVEGQLIRDRADDFAAANCVVLGASFDTVQGNLEFAQLQDFSFPLLSDIDHSVGAKYESCAQAIIATAPSPSATATSSTPTV